VSIAKIDADTVERCPGCGNVYVREGGKIIGRNFCWPLEVDTSQPGYAYLRGTHGYCYTLHRHVEMTETPWLERHVADLVRAEMGGEEAVEVVARALHDRECGCNAFDTDDRDNWILDALAALAALAGALGGE